MMNGNSVKSRWKWFLTCFSSAMLGMAVVDAATILLEGYVSFAIKDSNGVPLVDGSVIQIVGSGDGTIDPFPASGTNLLSATTGDDEIIGTITINSSDLGSNGTFFSADFTFDSDDISFLYLRAFDTTGSLTGLIDYGFSDIFSATGHQFGVLELDFIGDFSTTNTDNFVVIPEPGSGTLLLVFMTCLFGMRYSMRSRKGVAVPLERNSSLIDDEEKDWL